MNTFLFARSISKISASVLTVVILLMKIEAPLSGKGLRL